ncbi:MAG: hypothetical protein N2234_00160 [Planctomycetota bacterium]|nr:hypothetical protein [Planctomycetota bacterium]
MEGKTEDLEPERNFLVCRDEDAYHMRKEIVMTRFKVSSNE